MVWYIKKYIYLKYMYTHRGPHTQSLPNGVVEGWGGAEPEQIDARQISVTSKRARARTQADPHTQSHPHTQLHTHPHMLIHWLMGW